ncbi:MAG TPA: phospholipase D-like domain-containing protein [Gammaproteobacteria bacterium]
MDRGAHGARYGDARLSYYFQILFLIAHITVAVLAIGHALLYKRDPRSALGWIATCILFPIAGPLLYFFFGINRVRARARQLMDTPDLPETGGDEPDGDSKNLPLEYSELASIANAITGRPLLTGNSIYILRNGEQAYPAMLDAINQAQTSVHLSTYIFKTDQTGKAFMAALRRARERGVDVKVLIDGFGDFYSYPRASGQLKKLHITVRRFLPLTLLPPSLYLNLRNHRKILMIDSQIAFTGGMNIGDHHLVENSVVKHPVADLHFQLTGPIVRQLEEIFRHDWQFTTGEAIGRAFVPVPASGRAVCRTIADGPNFNVNKIMITLIGAVSAARRRVSIMTPYFLPPRELTGALQAAALRGVDVNIILPARNNLFYLHRATRNMLWEVLQHNVNVYYQPAPFSHAKVFIVDGHYLQIGSANLDPRSLRLNFELAVEIYDKEFGAGVEASFEEIRKRSRRITLEQVDNRKLTTRLLDALFWLFSPYM